MTHVTKAVGVPEIPDRAQILFDESLNGTYKRTDRLFIPLMLLQWLAGIVAALWLSPKTWAGVVNQTHIHVWAAFVLGGAITSLPVYLAFKRPGQVLTRHVIAVAQMLSSALLIHLTGGRIETHFHVFGSLAFLSFYRDWKVLLSATIVVSLDHFFRGVYWPQSVFGVLTPSSWRWMEHAGWVLFEDVFLLIAIKQSTTEVRKSCERQADVETFNQAIEKRVDERTYELQEEVIERRRAEEALRDREGLLNSTLESTADGILVVDGQGHASHMNTKFSQMWRIPAEVLSTKDDGQMIEHVLSQVSDPKGFLERVESLYQSREEALDTVAFVDGRVFERFSSPLLTDGVLAGRVWSFRDITKHREAERARLQLQEKLDRSQRFESLGQLAGGVAHDLNNMLGPVVGYSELLVQDLPADSKAAARARKIGKAAEEAAVVIQDLLALARRGRYDMIPLALNQVIHSYIDSPAFEALKERHPKIAMEINLSQSPDIIVGSAPHLGKVVMNLITNAFEAMSTGGTISVRTEHIHVDKLISGYQNIEKGHYLVLRIRDTGHGIAKEDIARIFEPYYSKKTLAQSGSGLGLSVVYGIVKDHKGFYDVLSEIGVGTEFILYFPAADTDVETAKLPAGQFAVGTERILIIDDSPGQRELAVELLEQLGYSVATAENGHTAAHRVRHEHFDLILLDMIMEPGFDGLETYREILKTHPKQKAVVVSGFSENDRVQAVLRLGAGGVVKKPYNIGPMSRTIRKALDAPWAQADPECSLPAEPVLTPVTGPA